MTTESLRDLEEIARAISLMRRKELRSTFASLASKLGLQPGDVSHLTQPAAAWPRRAESLKARGDELRYRVDFSYGDNPDHRPFVASFEEVRALLSYTRDSCKVAFGTNRGVVDRSGQTGRKTTRLGPCVITRLPEPINLSEHPGVLRLDVKAAELNPKRQLGGRLVRFSGPTY